MIEKINTKNFHERTKIGMCIVAFEQRGCEACVEGKKAYVLVSKRVHGVSLYTIDVDNKIGDLFNVEGTPTYIFFKDGQPLFKLSGARTYEHFARAIALMKKRSYA